MNEISQVGTAAVRIPHGDAPQSSSLSTHTGAFANHSVSVCARLSGDGLAALQSGERRANCDHEPTQKLVFPVRNRRQIGIWDIKAGPRKWVATSSGNKSMTCPASRRPVTGSVRAHPPARQPILSPARRRRTNPPSGTIRDEEALAFGPVHRLGNYVANEIERGNLPPALADDLQTAVVYAEQLDRDIGRACHLLEQSQAQPLTDAERRELSSLVGANKHNLALLQTWLGGPGGAVARKRRLERANQNAH